MTSSCCHTAAPAQVTGGLMFRERNIVRPGTVVEDSLLDASRADAPATELARQVTGNPFAPDARMKNILTDAANIGSVMARALTARPKEEMFYKYPGERVWTNPFIEGRYDFILNGATLLDSRVYMHFYATGITPAMAIQNVGKGSQYLIACLDKNGDALDGNKTYRIHLPPNVPAKDFWSFTLYDNQTRSMLQTDQRFPGVDNLGNGKANVDGSDDMYFGPKAPKGMENNWIQTVPCKLWNTIFRLCGPLENFLRQDVEAFGSGAGL